MSYETILLDVDAETRRARHQRAGKADRFEIRGEDFHALVQAGYRELAAGDDSIAIVDARGSIDEVQRALRALIAPLIARSEVGE